MKKLYFMTTLSLLLLSLCFVWIAGAGCGDDSNSIVTPTPNSTVIPVTGGAVSYGGSTATFANVTTATTATLGTATTYPALPGGTTLASVAYSLGLNPSTSGRVTLSAGYADATVNPTFIYSVNGGSWQVAPWNKVVTGSVTITFTGSSIVYGVTSGTSTTPVPTTVPPTVAPTVGPTATAVPPTAGPTATAVPPTAGPTATAVPPTAGPTATAAPITTPTANVNVTIN